MKAIVLLNKAAGSMAAVGHSGPRIVEQMAALGIQAELRIVSGDQILAEAKASASKPVDVVIAGGGDGTLSTVAGALAGTGMPLGVLPLGTLNHFAKDLGIPLDLAAAIQTIANGHIAAIDVGRVNDQVFINNSSLGIYPSVVLKRETQRRRRGLSKWTALVLAVFKVFRRFPLLQVRLCAQGQTIVRHTPLVFVGNNAYQLDLLNVGTRVCLNKGQLSLYIANTQNRWRMLMLTFRAILGSLKQARDFEATCLGDFHIETRRRRLRVAVDGEVAVLYPPLHYSVWPGALKVFVPETSAGQESPGLQSGLAQNALSSS